MSARALGVGVEAHLQAALSLDGSQCSLMPDGVPPAHCGQLFVAVHPGDCSADSAQALDERHGVLVTVTRRAAFAPHDRVGREVVYDRADGLLRWADRVKAAVHLSYDAMDLANAELVATAGSAAVYGFSEPPVFLGMTYLGVKGPEWFLAEPDDDAGAPAGVAVELRFGRARRLQPIEDQT